MDHALIVIGGGSAGLVAAQVAAAIGARVALVEREPWPGGDCLWTGCVPSKTLISIAQHAADARRAAAVGVHAADINIDFAAVMQAVRDAQEQIKPHDSFERLEQSGITAIRAAARVLAPHRIELTDADGTCRTITTRHILIAAGSMPVRPKIDGIDLPGVVTTESIWTLDELAMRPATTDVARIVGSGVIATPGTALHRALPVARDMPCWIPAPAIRLAANVNDTSAPNTDACRVAATVVHLRMGSGGWIATLDFAGQPAEVATRETGLVIGAVVTSYGIIRTSARNADRIDVDCRFVLTGAARAASNSAWHLADQRCVQSAQHQSGRAVA